MKKRVLQISKYYAPHIGGTEQTCQYLSEGLKDEYEVKVICFSDDKETTVQEINGIQIIRPGTFLTVARQPLSFSYWGQLHKVIKTWKPDVIHFHHPNPFVTALLLSIIPRTVKLYVQWHLDITNQKRIYPFIKPLETRLLKRADLISTTSPGYRDSSRPLLPFRNKTTILPSAINIQKLKVNTGDAQIIQRIKDKAKGRKIVFFIGRHVLHKGIRDLIEAEPLIKNECYIFIGGAGPITDEMKAVCKSNRVEFVGRLSDQEKKCYYHAADIFAFPSYSKAEGFGLTLAEAMYCNAVPVTYTIEGSGVNWVSLNGITGLEVPNRNIAEYAKAIDELLSNDKKRNDFAEAAHQRVVENFTIEKEIMHIKKQYRELLNE